MSKKPPVSVSAIHTGSGDSMVTNIDFAGGLLKDTRLERSPHGRGIRLVIHGEFEYEQWAAGFIKTAAAYQDRKRVLARPVGETADSVAGVEDASETKVDAAVATDPVVPVEDTSDAEEDVQTEAEVDTDQVEEGEDK